MAVYRVESGKVRHKRTYYHPGDEFEADLTEAQVAAMTITRVDGDAGEDGAASDDAAEAETDAEEAADDDETEEAEADGGVPEALTAEFVETAEYGELRTAAGRFDDVNGNWGEDRLRTELLAHVEG